MTLALERPEWQSRGLCNTGDAALVTVMVPSATRNPAVHYERAKRVCANCTVTSECLDYALKFKGLAGVWGGTTPAERARIRLERGIHTIVDPELCGTTAGYWAHRRRGETACLICRAAQTAYKREWQQGRGAAS